MAIKQTRRSVSISRPLYDQLKAHSEDINMPMSQIVETLVHTRCSAAPAQALTSSAASVLTDAVTAAIRAERKTNTEELAAIIQIVGDEAWRAARNECAQVAEAASDEEWDGDAGFAAGKRAAAAAIRGLNTQKGN